MNPTVKTPHVQKPKSARKFGHRALLTVTIVYLVFGASGSARASKGHTASSRKGAVAADEERCSEIGASFLRKGGHAVDAAVATALCIGVVNPLGSGIGGGSFMLVRSASTSKIQAYNMRETAPLAASQDMYEKDPKSKVFGARAMGVPGEIAGLHAAWKAHGRLPWKLLFEPAIRLAKGGFVVAPYLARFIEMDKEVIMADPGLRHMLAPNGRLLKSGDICYNEQLGRSLESIAELGPQTFYNGALGEKFVEEVRKAGGILTMKDLKSYKVEETNPIKFNVMGYTIYGMPPPSTGTVGLALVLNIFKAYRNTQESLKGLKGRHRLIEAMKHMFAVRMNLGDPNFVDIDSTVSKMLSPTYAAKVREKIHDNTTYPFSYYNATWDQVQDHGTSHFSIVDAQRNAVAMTTTVSHRFGAGVRLPVTGIILNNQMDDFSAPSEKSTDMLPPAPSNFIRPGKRPLSSMTPLIIMKNNEVAGVMGGGGGLQIAPAVLQVFINHFILGMSPDQAVYNPRVYHQLVPNVVYYDKLTTIGGQHIELSKGTIAYLESKGHELEPLTLPVVCQLIVQKQNKFRKGLLIAVSDPRKNGKPAVV